jgi:protein required for attachment to host cells
MSGYTVFVADSRLVRIFELDEAGATPKLLEVVENTYTARHNRDLGADAPGRVLRRTGASAQRTALQARTEHKQHATDRFARQLARRVGGAARNRKSRGVVLVAAPRFLSAVRTHLSKTAQQRIVREVPRDLVGMSILVLRRRLAEALRRL